jgi:hypothetical protein
VPLIPNGCDCFGCCQIAGKFVYSELEPAVQPRTTSTPATAAPSSRSAPTLRAGECELCFGQDIDDLPPECGGEPACEPGVMPCVDSEECSPGEFCQTGCCVPVIPM